MPGDMLELRSGPEDVIGMSLLSSTAVCAFRLADCSAIVTVDKLRVTSDNRPKGERLGSIKTALETLGVRDDTLTWAECDALDRDGFLPLPSILAEHQVQAFGARLDHRMPY